MTLFCTVVAKLIQEMIRNLRKNAAMMAGVCRCLHIKK